MIIERLKKARHNFYLQRFRKQEIEENKVLMWADGFKHYGCNPKYIALYLLEHYPKEFDIVWVFESNIEIPKDLPKQIKVVKYFSIEYLREISTAKFIICNARMNDYYYFKKRPEQVYIQTWHSSIRLKKIEGDATEGLGENYVRIAQKDSKKIDLLISGCDFSTNTFRRAFWYDGEILKSGTPRCDILINNSREIRKKVFDYYNIPYEKKLVLYAPTFRKSKKADVYGMEFTKLAERMKGFEKREWVFGCRLHPNIIDGFVDENCISMSKYSDMQELIVAADILITDYSSCMFDMMLANKKCVLYTPDLAEYLEKERGLYFDIQKLPFPIAENMESLCDKILNFDMDEYQKKLQQFKDKIGSYEKGTAAKQVADYMLKKKKEGRKIW